MTTEDDAAPVVAATVTDEDFTDAVFAIRFAAAHGLRVDLPHGT